MRGCVLLSRVPVTNLRSQTIAQRIEMDSKSKNEAVFDDDGFVDDGMKIPLPKAHSRDNPSHSKGNGLGKIFIW